MSTKSMSEEADALELYGDNTSEIYHRHFIPIVKNLANKRARGVYDSAKGVTAFMYVADAAAKRYTKEFGSSSDWYRLFPTSVRREYARSMERSFRDDYDRGEYEDYLTAATKKVLQERSAPRRAARPSRTPKASSTKTPKKRAARRSA